MVNSPEAFRGDPNQINIQMKKIIISITVIATVVIMTALPSCISSKASSARLLRFNLEKGKEYDYDIIWDMDQQVMGNETKISIAGLYSLKVTDDNGTEKTITATYRRFIMNMKMMGMEIDVDTDKPSPPLTKEEMEKNPMGIMNRIFAGITGKPFVMKADQEGNILAVTGFQEMLRSMVDSLAFNETIRAQMMASLKDQFNEQSVKDQFSQVFTIFPDKEVAVGDSWEKRFSTGGKTPANYKTNYTVTVREGDSVTLASKTTIEPAGGTVVTEVKGTQTGTIQIDSKSGLMVNGDFDQKLEVMTNGVKVDMAGKGKIKGKAK
jgi:hypothetical protein